MAPKILNAASRRTDVDVILNQGELGEVDIKMQVPMKLKSNASTSVVEEPDNIMNTIIASQSQRTQTTSI